MTHRLSGAPNFRDLGGLRSRDGRSIGNGRVLRSGHLGELQEQDIVLLRGWLGGDVCVVDLRGSVERTKLACVLPEAAVHSLPIEPSVAQKLDAVLASGEPLTPAITARFMAGAYENFARSAHAQVAGLFELALARSGRPMLVHCAAGKDRTGFMVALLLAALDVPREVIVEDYLETNRRVTPRESRRYAPEIMEVLGTVRPEFLEAALAVVDGEFGGVDAYLLKAASLTAERRAALQRALLMS